MSRVSEKPVPREKPPGKSILWWGIAAAVPLAITAGVLTKARIEQGANTQVPVAPVVSSVNAIGRLQPQGEVIKLSAPTGIQGTSRVDQLLVKEGQKVRKGQVIAVLDSFAGSQANLEQAKAKIQESRANLAIVRVGSPREIQAQQAVIARINAQLDGEQKANDATIARLQAQLQGETISQQATVNRLSVELEGQQDSLRATVARVQAEAKNAQVDAQRYEQLYRQGAISQQERDRRQLTAQTATQQLIESQASRRQVIASLREQLAQATADRGKTIAILRQQLIEARANQNKTLITLQKQIEEEKANLERLQEIRPSNAQMAQAQVGSAIAQMRKAEADMKLSYVIAPITGEILEIHTKAGETMSAEGIAEIGRTDEMIVVAEVPESGIGRVRLGQLASIVSDNGAFSGNLQGTVSEIGRKIGKKDVLNNDPAADVDARVVEVKISLSEQDAQRVAGLTNAKVIATIQI
ncbi:HlyD family efflux transporter periplasmic adaptor subunit [Rivularia sp. UHCC 0363]|uniref:HlyD family efflux transporter periplasmic adaptor subunit n=1 Tax=Rivularia sp. UHCC 0363 TaxID=3110244 RepID=UPI002B1EA888|nr:HlyD family efflux transporter periplasmic adaptor subunit [Rivularia sp. UHCC 0363]MEA5593903.1 HlyD family efflux transporter periplasmic adaptor subunit [Rivularia sp. UHCC 0363]